jgi:hypothetical protein
VTQPDIGRLPHGLVSFMGKPGLTGSVPTELWILGSREINFDG